MQEWHELTEIQLQPTEQRGIKRQSESSQQMPMRALSLDQCVVALAAGTGQGPDCSTLINQQALPVDLGLGSGQQPPHPSTSAKPPAAHGRSSCPYARPVHLGLGSGQQTSQGVFPLKPPSDTGHPHTEELLAQPVDPGLGSGPRNPHHVLSSTWVRPEDFGVGSEHRIHRVPGAQPHPVSGPQDLCDYARAHVHLVGTGHGPELCRFDVVQATPWTLDLGQGFLPRSIRKNHKHCEPTVSTLDLGQGFHQHCKPVAWTLDLGQGFLLGPPSAFRTRLGASLSISPCLIVGSQSSPNGHRTWVGVSPTTSSKSPPRGPWTWVRASSSMQSKCTTSTASPPRGPWTWVRAPPLLNHDMPSALQAHLVDLGLGSGLLPPPHRAPLSVLQAPPVDLGVGSGPLPASHDDQRAPNVYPEDLLFGSGLLPAQCSEPTDASSAFTAPTVSMLKPKTEGTDAKMAISLTAVPPTSYDPTSATTVSGTCAGPCQGKGVSMKCSFCDCEWSQPEVMPADAKHDASLSIIEFQHRPVNPRLLWPRYEPRCLPISVPDETTGDNGMPPTQKFRVHLGAQHAPHDAHEEQVAGTPTTMQHDMSLCFPSRKRWPEGGLDGGSKAEPLVDLTGLGFKGGWWLCIPGGPWISIPWSSVAGRTIRQERETLQLMNTDTTVFVIILITSQGVLEVTWNYKFPHRAHDEALLLVLPRQSWPVESAKGVMSVFPPFPGKACGLRMHDGSHVRVQAPPVDLGVGSGYSLHSPLSLRYRNLDSMPGSSCDVASLSNRDSCKFSQLPSSLSQAQVQEHLCELLPCNRDHHFGEPTLSMSDGPTSRSRMAVKTQKSPMAKQAAKTPAPGEAIPNSRTVFFAFLGGWRCVMKRPGLTVAQVLEEEWGIASHLCTAALNGRHVSMRMEVEAVPKDMPVRVSFRLRGGVAAYAKKLKDLLVSKGVPEEELSSRSSEIYAAIGENGVAEAFSCFDSWQALKAKCHGKVRIVRQTEARHSKSKRSEEETDALQENDPWAEALQGRQLRPDPSFFQTSEQSPPVILQSVTHGVSGLALVEEKEASLLAASDQDLSPDALAVIVLGEPNLDNAKRPNRVIEFPCVDGAGTRMLVKGTIIDLGATRLQVVGENAVHQMQVVPSACIAIEAHKAELEDWQDFIQAPIRFLKKAFALSADQVLHSWAKKAFRQGKIQQNFDQADSAFLMLRVKACIAESILKVALPGLYSSPRLEEGQPDHTYKVVWCADKTTTELRVIAPSIQGYMGLVKSRTGCGVRVRCQDYSTVKSKLYPAWVPQKDTPYDVAMPLRFELHNVHPGASKDDLQVLINGLAWRALVIKQSKPRQWVVASADPPPRDTILTEHGCILALPCTTVADKGWSKGKGKGQKGKGKSPNWLLGSNTMSNAVDYGKPSVGYQQMPLPQGDPNGPVKKAMLEVEQKMEERMASLKEEAAATHRLMQQDIKDMRKEMQEQATQQRQEVQAVSQRVDGIESGIAAQLSTFMANLNNTLVQQNAELSGRIQEGHESLRTELTAELRQHVGNARKRTPPPPDAEVDKVSRRE